MRIPKYIETLALIIESLKKDILSEYGLSWTEYLVLCLVNEFEIKERNPTPQEIIRTSGKNRAWIYKAIRKLNEEAYISFSKGKSIEPGKLYVAVLGRITLRRINTILAKRVRGIRKESYRCLTEEDTN